MYEDQNPGRLLLLCLWITGKPAPACLQLRYDGAWHDRSHQVSIWNTYIHSFRSLLSKLPRGLLVLQSLENLLILLHKQMEN